MKQRLYRMVWLLLILLAVYWQWGAHWPTWQFDSGTEQVDFEQASVATVYPLQQGQRLEFPLNSARFPLRVLSNASLEHRAFQAATASINLANGDEPKRWHYQVHYQILDEQNQVLTEKAYHFWSYPQFYEGQTPDERVTKHFYADSQRIAADTRLMLIAPDQSIRAQARRLRIHITPLDQGIEDIAIRLYERIQLDDKQITYRWQRLSAQQKEALVEGNIYGPAFLTDQEKFNLLRYRIQPLGALGVLGQDYQQRKLYSRNLADELPEQYRLYSAGYNFGGHLLAVLPIARVPLTQVDQPQDQRQDLASQAGTAEVTLNWLFSRREQSDQGSDTGMVQFTWISANGQTQRSWTQEVQSGQLVAQRLAEGTLLLSSAEQWLVRQWQLIEVGQPSADAPDRAQRIEIQPKVNQLRVYRPVAEQVASLSAQPLKLRYRIPTYGHAAVPLRVDVRQHLNPEAAMVPHHAAPAPRMRWLDAQGQLIREWVLADSLALNPFEQMIADPNAQLSQAQPQYFMLPEQVAEIEILGGSQHLISLYTRPEALPRVINVPEDYQPFSEQAKMPYWFMVLPQHAQQLQMQGQSLLLELRPQPQAPLDPELLSGQYHWQSYTPEGDWLGRYIISPRETQLPLRIESAPVSLQKIEAGHQYTVHFQHAYRPQVSPELFYFRHSIRPETVKIWLNGQLWASQRIGQSQGKLTLPKINTDSRAKLRIESEPNIQWYLSHQLSQSNSYLRRLVAKVPSNGVIEIPFEKTAPQETLTLTFYQGQAHSNLDRIPLALEIVPQQPLKRTEVSHTQWSALKRHYRIALDTRQKSQVLEQNQQLYSTHPAYVTLAEDLPAGRYRLKLTLDAKQSEYFSILQRRSGLKDPNDLYFDALPGRYDD